MLGVFHLEAEFLFEPETYSFSKASQPASSWNPPVSTSLMLVLQAHVVILRFLFECWGFKRQS